MIPGVRNHVENIGIDTLEQMDVMRGEETEAVALLRERGKGEDLILFYQAPILNNICK